MAARSFWIKERSNPQLGTYYVKCGQITANEAKRFEKNCLYGSNTMHKFGSEREYLAEIERLESAGEKVQ